MTEPLTLVGSEQDNRTSGTNSSLLKGLSIHSFSFLIAHSLLLFVLSGTTPWHSNTRSSSDTTEKRIEGSHLPCLSNDSDSFFFGGVLFSSDGEFIQVGLFMFQCNHVQMVAM